ncbi:MAG: cation transporter dimerization domain-containing protein, partial [Terriglobales bacterium]
WSTVVVMLGIAVVWAGDWLGVPALRYADPLAALVVSGVIIWIGSRLGKRTVDALLDAAPRGLQERIASEVGRLEGVLVTERVRVRRAGNRHFVDVTISVPRTLTFEQVHAISDAVERRVQQMVDSDVMVHMEPRAHAGENLFDLIRAVAQRRGQAIHELYAYQLNGRFFVGLHLEVSENLSLREAHREATDLEEEIRKLPGLGEGHQVADVTIHIEPLQLHIPSADEMQDLSLAVQQHVNALRGEYHELRNCHEVKVRSVERKIRVSCHCAMDGSLPITQVHDVTAALEDRVKEQFPQIFEINIHPEPTEES